nr:MAG TPA: hypothetical protein [Caudoviricetes sp.]
MRRIYIILLFNYLRSAIIYDNRIDIFIIEFTINSQLFPIFAKNIFVKYGAEFLPY